MTGWRLASRRLHPSGGCPKWFPKVAVAKPSRWMSKLWWVSKPLLFKPMPNVRVGWREKAICRVDVQLPGWISKVPSSTCAWRFGCPKELVSGGELRRRVPEESESETPLTLWETTGTMQEVQQRRSSCRGRASARITGEKQGTEILLYSSRVSRWTRIVVTVGFSPRD